MLNAIPRCSMYGIFKYIWVFFGANVDKYAIHGAFGIETWSSVPLFFQICFDDKWKAPSLKPMFRRYLGVFDVSHL